MKRLIVMGLLAGIGTLGSAAELHRVGGDTIALRGAIAEGDVDPAAAAGHASDHRAAHQ